MSRQRLTAARWQTLIDQQRSSGRSVGAFCRQQGVAACTFYAWRRRLAKPTFVEVKAGASERVTASSPLVLVLRGGVRVQVRAGFDAGLLRRLVEALS
jgi:uncharacterized protein (AIM24 family)